MKPPDSPSRLHGPLASAPGKPRAASASSAVLMAAANAPTAPLTAITPAAVAPLTAVAGPAPDPAAEALKLAAEHEQAGRLDEADATLDALLADRPEHAEAIHFKGVVAVRRGHTEDGARLMERSVAIGPVRAYYLRNLCEVYRTLGRYDEALACGRRGAQGDPADPICHANLSVLHYERGEPAEAIAAAERALAINDNLPGAHFGLAEALLLRGEMERGWEEYEWRFRMPGVPPLMPRDDIPQWDGKPLKSGRLLLIADQGFGDGIQFGRYIPWAAQRVPELVLACSRELQPLLGQLDGVATLFDRWEAAPECAAFLPLSGLPRVHGTRLDTVPADIPYLRADPALAARWKARVDALAAPGHRRIGLVWAGRPTHKNDRNRSVALTALTALTDLPGVTFVGLQKGPGQAQVGGYFGRAPIINLGPEIEDFADSMAVIDGLEQVVTVDTAIGHLAGAMGKPVSIMLPFAPDWRWLEARADTPWYPSVRLFRPTTPRDWPAVTRAVADAIMADA